MDKPVKAPIYICTPVKCLYCGGKGIIKDTEKIGMKICPSCDGKGKV